LNRSSHPFSESRKRLYDLFHDFQQTLPWSQASKAGCGTMVEPRGADGLRCSRK